MKTRRHHSIIVLLVASVFLCLITACGVPTYIVPTVTVSNVTPETDTDSFTLSYSSESLGDEGKVGLLLLYSIEDTTPVKQSSLVSSFKSSYSPTQYDGVPISASDNEAVVSVTVASTDYKLYPLYSSSTRTLSAPDYSHAMDTSGAFTNEVRIDYDSANTFAKLYLDGAEASNLYFASSVAPTSNYIGLYAAVSVQSPNFSNIYWSSLFFVGYIRIE